MNTASRGMMVVATGCAFAMSMAVFAAKGQSSSAFLEDQAIELSFSNTDAKSSLPSVISFDDQAGVLSLRSASASGFVVKERTSSRLTMTDSVTKEDCVFQQSSDTSWGRFSCANGASGTWNKLD